MTGVLIDTHVWAWTLIDEWRLSKSALAEITMADTVWISPLSVYEIAQKVRLNKWPEMVRLVGKLDDLITLQLGQVAQISPTIALRAGTLDWPHRDPFDRIIAATALVMDLTLISADTVFDTLPLRRCW